MSKKLKYYFIGVSIISIITCVNIIPLRNSYGDNTVVESSVSYETVVENRGLIRTNKEYSKYLITEQTDEIQSFSIASYTVEQPVTGINMTLATLDNSVVEELIEANDTKCIWTTKRVNLRSEPSTNSDIITTLDKRVKVQKISSSDKWVKVIYDKKVGYVNKKYLRNTELPSLDFTDEDIDLLAKIIWLESRGESDEGMAAVTTVIINRVLHMKFSDTLYEVLSDKGEFSSWKLLDTAKPKEREYEIIEEVLRGDWKDTLTENHVYFSTKARNSKGTIKIGNHFFCEY